MKAASGRQPARTQTRYTRNTGIVNGATSRTSVASATSSPDGEPARQQAARRGSRPRCGADERPDDHKRRRQHQHREEGVRHHVLLERDRVAVEQHQRRSSRGCPAGQPRADQRHVDRDPDAERRPGAGTRPVRRGCGRAASAAGSAPGSRPGAPSAVRRTRPSRRSRCSPRSPGTAAPAGSRPSSARAPPRRRARAARAANARATAGRPRRWLDAGRTALTD